MNTKHTYRLSILLVFCLVSLLHVKAQDSHEANSIKELVTASYLEPLYQKGSIEKIKEGFHEGFNMYVLYKGKFSTRTRDAWIEKIKAVRTRNLPEKAYSWKFDMIDIAGQTAMVKLNIFEKEELKYIDYLTLYKFNEGWKVITKQFSMY